MARVYTSRQLIDPNLANYMEQVIQNRVANQLNRDKMLGDSVRHMLTGVGSAVDEAYTNWKNKKEEQARYDQIMGQSTIAQQSDPNYIAAVKDYAKTGNAQPITSYMLGKEAAEARKLEAQKREDEAAANKTRDTNIRRENDRIAYLKAQKDMLDAMKAGDYSSAEIYKSQMNSIENRWEPGTFGKSSDELYDARKREIDEAAEKQRIKETSEQLKAEDAQRMKEDSYNQRIWYETEVLPNLKNINDKGDAKRQVERLYAAGQLTDEDRKALHAKIDGTETVGEGKQRVHKQKAEEATGKAIDESRNKADAQQYVGKKLNSLEWNKIPAEQKKYLNRDAQGVVTEK